MFESWNKIRFFIVIQYFLKYIRTYTHSECLLDTRQHMNHLLAYIPALSIHNKINVIKGMGDFIVKCIMHTKHIWQTRIIKLQKIQYLCTHHPALEIKH